MSPYYLYILASRHHQHIALGVTTDLASGVQNHRRLVARRLQKSRVWQKLVYVELIMSLDDAVERELQLKKSNRRQLCRLIESVNPGWDSISLSRFTAGLVQPESSG